MEQPDIQFVCNLINYFGSDEHPLVTIDNYLYFKKNYVLECIGKGMKHLEAIKKSVETEDSK